MPPSTQTTFKQHDAASYDDVADRFEGYTERFTVPIARHVVDLAALLPESRVLDVGCGTGIVSRLAAAAMPPSARVVGLDLSDGMLRLASSLAQAELGAGRIDFCKGDAEHLEFPDRSFDAVLSLYALRHFPNPLQALSEMFRVGRPGTKVIVGIGSSAPFLSAAFLANGWRLLTERAQRVAGRGPLHATACLDRLIAKHAGTTGPLHGTADSVGSLAQALRGVGYTNVWSRWVGQTSLIASSDDFWGLQLTLSTLARKTWPTMTERQRAALRQEFDEVCRAHLRRGGTLMYRSGALIAVGTRPA